MLGVGRARGVGSRGDRMRGGGEGMRWGEGQGRGGK